MISCATQKEDDCAPIAKPIELTFSDSSLQNITFSPFEKGKMWVKTNNPNGAIWEIDKLSGQKTILDKEKAQFFFIENAREQYRYKDQHDSLVWIGAVKKLELLNRNIDDPEVINQKYWQSAASFFYSFDSASNEVEKYRYRLSDVNKQPMSYEIDSRFIWITRPGQVMLISLADNQLFDFPIIPGDGYIQTIFDECNVYILYKNKFMLYSKEDFIKKCTLFDEKQFNQEIHQFDAVVDSLRLSSDTILSVSLAKLNYLKKRYQGVKNIGIVKKLRSMNTNALQNNIYQFSEGYTTCYQDSSRPTEQRKSCLEHLLEKYGRSANFDQVMLLKKEYIRYFGPLERSNENPDFVRQLDSVETYFAKIGYFQSTITAEDSLYYFESIALESICLTRWYCHEGCGGCDFSLVTNRLNLFMTKFPESALVDNCTLYLLNDKYSHDILEDELLKAQNRDYENFLKKFPDSDVTAEVQFAIFNNWMSMENKSKIKATGQRFIRTFGTDKRADYVKERIKELKF